MSIIAKQTFLRELSETLSHNMTGDNVSHVINVLTDQLSRYDIEQLENSTDQKEYSDMLELFLNAKLVEGRSPKTIARYRYIINRLFEEEKTPIREMTVYNLRQYITAEKRRGISDSSIVGYRDVFSSFFGWLHSEGLIPRNPCANLNTIKCRKEIRLPFTSRDIDKLKECCETDRDKAIITFLLATGCRIGEVCALNRSDVDLRNYECLVLGKGNKERTVYLDKVAVMYLENYLCNREDDAEPLFIGKGKKRLLAGGVRTRLNEIAEMAGVENVHPHRFRRTLATNLIKHGMPIQEVAMILGHEKIDTTMRYVYIDKENVKNSYKKYI